MTRLWGLLFSLRPSWSDFFFLRRINKRDSAPLPQVRYNEINGRFVRRERHWSVERCLKLVVDVMRWREAPTSSGVQLTPCFSLWAENQTLICSSLNLVCEDKPMISDTDGYGNLRHNMSVSFLQTGLSNKETTSPHSSHRFMYCNTFS